MEQKDLERIAMSMGKKRKLAGIKDLINAGIVTGEEADIILRFNPLGNREIIIVGENMYRMVKRLGISIPEPTVRVTPRIYKPECFEVMQSWEGIFVDAPEKGYLHTPLAFAAAYAEIYQENRHEIVKGDIAKYAENTLMRFGWKQFIAELCAAQFDAQLASPAYASILVKNDVQYSQGANLYRAIYDRDGMQGALYAARALRNDEELLHAQSAPVKADNILQFSV